MPSDGQTAGTSSNDQVELLALLTPLRHHWLRFLAIWVLVSAGVLAGLLSLRPSFESSGSLYLEEKGSSGSDQMIADILPDLFGDADLESQKRIIRSAALASKVIRELGRNTKLDGPKEYLPARPPFWRWRLHPDPARYDLGLVARRSMVRDHVFQPIEYAIRFHDSHRFAVLHADEEVARGELNAPVETDDAAFSLHYGGGPELAAGVECQLTIAPVQGSTWTR